MKWIYYKTDIKRLLNEPIMTLLLAAPLILCVVFMAIITFVPSFLIKYLQFDFAPYIIYVQIFALVIIAGLLAIVMGFSMLDDEDNAMITLFSVTPLGKGGYVFMRISMAGLLCALYSAISLVLLGPATSFGLALVVVVLNALYTATLGLLLFMIAKDKVQGLTLAKALNVLNLFAFSHLASSPWLHGISAAFPAYWFAKLLLVPAEPVTYLLAFGVNAIWFVVVLMLYLRKTKSA